MENLGIVSYPTRLYYFLILGFCLALEIMTWYYCRTSRIKSLELGAILKRGGEGNLVGVGEVDAEREAAGKAGNF